MEYSIGKPARIIAVRLFEGEDIYQSIESLAEKENIRNAAVFITGGIRKAEVVVGPKTETPKIQAEFTHFEGPGEALGVGTIYPDSSDKPKLHLHAAMARQENLKIGCPRGGASVFLILEITIIEFDGINGSRKLDPKTGFELLRF